MRSLDDAKVVAQLVRSGTEAGIAFGPASDAESSHDVEQEVVRRVTEGVNADVLGTKTGYVRAANRGSIHDRAERVHHAGTEQIGITESGRLGQIVPAPGGRNQNIRGRQS